MINVKAKRKRKILMINAVKAFMITMMFYIVTLLMEKTAEAIIIIMLFAILTALVNISLQLHDMLKRKAMCDDKM